MKKTFKHLLAAAMLLLAATTPSMAQQLPPIPVDDAVTIGRLDNGLTYYIRHNEWPEHVANFYIAQRVGSIQEDDSQRGLAHFLEHMAFNGSEHFPGNSLIDFTRSLGVSFGNNLNAYTSIDQTVYRVCDVPTKRQSALDSCLLILKDWSNGLLLEEEEIIKERDVVHNEWRMGEGPQQRMITRSLPKLYPGSKYGERMPIGLMSVIDSFRPQTLMNYYKKWYRPDNQAIIVVGDIDVKHTEAKIKELFSGIVVPENAAQVVAEPVPDNDEAIYIVEKDKEMTSNILLVMQKHDAVPDDEKGNLDYLLQSYLLSSVTSMLNARLNELSQEPDCPFLQASADYGQYLLSRSKDCFELQIVPKEGKDLEALKAVMVEVRRAAEHGFTATEYERTRSNFLASIEKAYTNRDKRRNDTFGDNYRDHYLSNEPIPTIDFLYDTYNSILPMLPVEMVNSGVPEIISQNDTNLVVMLWAREADGLTYPTEADLKAAVEASRAEEVTAYIDNVKDEPLMATLPKKGTIKKEKRNDTLGYTELTLSNKATVLLKKTDFKNDEVQLQAWSMGGKSLYGESDYTNLKLFDEIIGYSGLAGFSGTELSKALAGKKCNADATMGLTRQYVTASSTPKDLETMFQMMYLYFTDISKDEKQVQNLIAQLDMALKNKNLNPQAVYSDSLTNTIYAHNPRFTNIQAEDLAAIDYDRILEIAKERYQNAGQFTFVIVGNFDEETIRPLVEQYIASLPATKKKAEKFRDVRTFAQGEVVNNFTVKTESPNAMSIEIYSAPIEYNLKNSIIVDMLGQVLSQIYLATIREQESAAYTCGSYGQIDLSGSQPIVRLMCISQGNPEKNARAVELLKEAIVKQQEQLDNEILTKVKTYMLKKADEDAKSNGHWIGVLNTWKDYGLDFQTDYKQTVEAVSAADVEQLLKQIVAAGNHIECIMMPEQ